MNLQPWKKPVVSITDQEYFDDVRWKEATKLADEARFPECQKLVAQINKEHERDYY